MSKALSPEEIHAGLAGLPGWTFAQEALAKSFAFTSFKEAFSFMTRVAFEAEAMNHHPEWTNVYSKVTVRLSTHDAGNKVTSLDLELARRIQKLSWTG